jgi:glycosyltransferase involved in cell wall biosynthesis
MKKILYVAAFFPSKSAGHAGGRVAFENLMMLQKKGQVDAVVCTSEDIAVESRQGIRVILQGKLSFIRYLATNFRVLSWQALLTAPVIHTRLNNDAEGVLSELLRIQDYDEVFVDFTQCLLLLNRALALSGKSPKFTACIHDVFAQRMIRSRRLVDIALTGIVCRQEQELIGFLDCITVLSTKDRDLVRSLYSATTVEVKPFFPPDWCANVDRRPDRIDPTKIVFFGNFDRFENSSAARWFVANAMAEIQSVIPGVTLILVGTGSDRLARQIGIVNVVGTGFVEDPSKYFSSCGCSIAPLFEGAGVKFKVLEALACGVPVIGTAVACEGIAQQSMLLHAESGTFAAETIRILQMAHHMQAVPAIR